ncbi:hypothetical protein PENTCL1PPCAC_28198, partial [Pristionchus entomophagus]
GFNWTNQTRKSCFPTGSSNYSRSCTLLFNDECLQIHQRYSRIFLDHIHHSGIASQEGVRRHEKCVDTSPNDPVSAIYACTKKRIESYSLLSSHNN